MIRERFSSPIAQYAVITANYWSFTLTDGALRMLIVLHFYQLGYDAWSVAMLFLFYEFFGVVTNLLGGWLGARVGLNRTMNLGLLFQAIALLALLAPADWLTIPWVMAAQALSGIAKDLNKMSAKSGIKQLVPEQATSQLFKWVAWLTGSKNTLKGAGYFLGGWLLWLIGFQATILVLFAMIGIAGVVSLLLLQRDFGKSTKKSKFAQVFSTSTAINQLSLARLFLFASRDIWFVVALPIALAEHYQWSHTAIGTFFASWIIIYGLIQSSAPRMLQSIGVVHIEGKTALWVTLPLLMTMAVIAGLSYVEFLTIKVLIAALFVFAFVFALNSAVHSYLIVHWARHDGASLDVGFYYMSNAAGRLLGTVLSGVLYSLAGLTATLFAAAVAILLTSLISVRFR